MPKTQQEFVQKNEKGPHWIESIYENCESVGVSKLIIKRFSIHFLSKEGVKND